MSTTRTTVVPGFSWSYSQLSNYETCAKRYAHYNVLKDVSEPETDAQREGKELHKVFEDYLLGRRTDLPLGYGPHRAMLDKIKASGGKLYGEQKLAITSSFAPCTYFSKAPAAWFRTIIDIARVDGPTAAVLDWKTGKVKEDITQLQLMAAALFAHDPGIQRIKSALVFVNQGHIEPAEFVREDLTEIWSEVLPRVKKMERARAQQEYPPKPGGLCKRYCAVTSCPHHGR